MRNLVPDSLGFAVYHLNCVEFLGTISAEATAAYKSLTSLVYIGWNMVHLPVVVPSLRSFEICGIASSDISYFSQNACGDEPR